MASVLNKYKFTIISFTIILFCTLALFLTASNIKPAHVNTSPTPIAPTPSPTPFTLKDAGSQIDQMGDTIDTTINQMTVDVKMSQTDASQDSSALSPLQKNAVLLIQNRILDLTDLSSRIATDNLISPEDRQPFTVDVKQTIQDLAALKNTLENETDLDKIKTDSARITTYKIYAVFIPRETLLLITADLSTLSAKTRLFASKLSGLADSTSHSISALTDITTRLTTIDESLKADKILVENVTTQTSNPTSVFITVRQDLMKTKSSFTVIRTELDDVKTFLATYAKTTPATSVTPVTSQIPNPSCVERPKCLDSHPRCAIAEPFPNHWCPTPMPPQ